MNDNKQKRG